MLKEINYLEIFRKALGITWSNKLLWVFGFLIFFGSGGPKLFLNWKNDENLPADNFIRSLFENHTALLSVLLLIFIVMLLLIAIRAVGQASIISFVGKEKLEVSAKFAKIFSAGKQYLGKLLLIDLSISLILFALLATLSVPIIFLFLAESVLLASIVGIFAALIFLPVWILVYFIRKFSYMYVVLAKQSVKNSIENAYSVFRDNMLRSIIFTIILSLLGVLIGLSLIMLLILVGVPLFLIGYVLSLFFSPAILYVVAGLGLVLLGSFLILSQSIFETFKQICWTFFFNSIAGLRFKKEEIAPSIAGDEITLPEQI